MKLRKYWSKDIKQVILWIGKLSIMVRWTGREYEDELKWWQR